MSPCHGEDRGFDSRLVRQLQGPIAQLVEQGTENPCVAGSIPAWATRFENNDRVNGLFLLLSSLI